MRRQAQAGNIETEKWKHPPVQGFKTQMIIQLYYELIIKIAD